MASPPPSHIYYFDVGAGSWVGTFDLKVTSWRRLLGARIGVKNTLLVAAMRTTQTLTGPSHLTSVVVPHPEEGPLGVVDNDVRLSRFGVELYSLQERYELDADGRSVWVVAHERFGPIPRTLSRAFAYPAEIRADGLGSTYHMPLLGSPWIATYEVGADRASLAGTLQCDWALAHEQARRQPGGQSTRVQARAQTTGQEGAAP
jgi:hypothetical protein